MSVEQQDWAEYVNVAGCNYNVAMHSVTKKLPYKVAYGIEPIRLTDLALEGVHSTLAFNQDGELAKEQKQLLKNTKLLLEEVQKCYKRQANVGRCKIEYEVHQKVLLNVRNFIMLEGLIPKFMSKFVRLFSIVGWMFKDVHKLELLPKIKMLLTFHVSLLKPFKKDTL